MIILNVIPIYFRARTRKLLQWTKKHTAIINNYFQQWIEIGTKGLPGKEQILVFQKHHPSVDCDWTKVRNKVQNERQAHQKRRATLFPAFLIAFIILRVFTNSAMLLLLSAVQYYHRKSD
jgi:hypothetical protein